MSFGHWTWGPVEWTERLYKHVVRRQLAREFDLLYNVTVLTDEFSSSDIEFHRETAASYDAEITATYGVYHRLLLEPYLDQLAVRLGPARALDLGCGTGVVSLALAQRGFDVLGIDHSREIACVLRPGGFFYISEPCREETPLKRGPARARRRTPVASGPQSQEAPISAGELSAELERLGFEFEMQFLMHLPPLRAVLPERLYVLAVRFISWPWRRRSGDLIFVFGCKPVAAEVG